MSELLMLEKRELFKSTLEPMFVLIDDLIRDLYNKVYDEEFNKTFDYIKPKRIAEISLEMSSNINGIKNAANDVSGNDLKDIDSIFSDEVQVYRTFCYLHEYMSKINKNTNNLLKILTRLAEMNTWDKNIGLDIQMMRCMLSVKTELESILNILIQLGALSATTLESYEINKSEIFRWQD